MAIVFSDTFTNAGSDANITAWPSSGSPDYAYNLGSGSNLFVSAANDRCEVNVLGVDVFARIINAAVPTGDQEIIGTVFAEAGSGIFGSGYVAVRCATGGNLGNLYAVVIDLNAANETQLWRWDDGTPTMLASWDLVNGQGTRTVRLRATGTNPVVLEVQVNATTTQTFQDSNANRKQSGPPGIGCYRDTSNSTAYVDTISVDDLQDEEPPEGGARRLIGSAFRVVGRGGLVG